MITRPITRSITRAITRSIAGVETIVLIELEAAVIAYYSLSSAWVATDDFSIKLNYDWDGGGNVVLVGYSLDVSSYIAIISGGKLRASIAGIILDTAGVVVTPNELETLEVKRVSNVVSIVLNGAVVATRTAAGTVSLDNFGRYASGLLFNGIISKPSLTDLTTPANSLEFTLGNITANTEVNNGVTLTYNNIATTQDVRDTYTLSNDGTQWVGGLQTIDIAAQA
jgi:hypothetical protein